MRKSKSLAAVWLLPAILMIVVLAGTSCSGGNDSPESIDLSKLLPASDAAPGFVAGDSAITYDKDGIWNYIGPDADIYLYNGFRELLHQAYTGEAGSEIVVDIFSIADPRKSFALYANLRSPGYEFVDVQTEGFLSGDTLLLKKGNFMVRLAASDQAARGQLLPLARDIAGRIKANDPFPAELSHFPKADLIPRSEKVTLAGFWGRTELSDVFSAMYLLDTDTVTLSFRLGSDNQISNVVKQYIGDNGTISELLIEGGNQYFAAEHDELGKLYCTVQQGALCLVSGYDNRAAAMQLLNRFYEGLKAGQ